jgi:predicted RNase H-like HicB family nuclease
MLIKIALEPSEEGGYTAIAPSLPGCISEGNSREEAIKNIREAIELYLEPVEDDQILRINIEIDYSCSQSNQTFHSFPHTEAGQTYRRSVE